MVRSHFVRFLASIHHQLLFRRMCYAGADFFKYWKLEPATVEFLMHSCALYRDESYMNRPALEILERMQVGNV